MHLRDVLLATLAGLSVAGCCTDSLCDCDPDDESFEIDQALTVAEVDAAVARWGLASDDALACEQLCESVYLDTRGWQATQVESCAMTLPEDGGDDGSLACAGKGIEYYCEGRRPLGHVEAVGEGGDPLGRACASMAYLEAASVDAFEELARQLHDLAAPEELVDRCLRAAEDERAHARWLSAVASRRGASVPPARARPGPSTLLRIALQNAVEGCVYETWAALAAHVRARRASDPLLRRVFARIAADETRHGQLAWDLHAWLLEQLDAPGRARVLAAQARALASLPSLARSQSAAPAALGHPAAADAEALATDLARRLAA